MGSRPEEFAPVEAISDEERRKLVRALVAHGDQGIAVLKALDDQHAESCARMQAHFLAKLAAALKE
jgi:hypothetical protein